MLAIIVVGVFTRTIFHLGHNIEFITAISLASGYFFVNKKLAFLSTLLTLAISDLIIGNSIIFIFTWSAFLFGTLLGVFFSEIDLTKYKFIKLVVGAEIAGILSTIIFFLWTNFGVVLTTNAYQKNLEGVMQSYINALPFLRPQMSANIIIVPLIFAAGYILLKSDLAKRLVINLIFIKFLCPISLQRICCKCLISLKIY